MRRSCILKLTLAVMMMVLASLPAGLVQASSHEVFDSEEITEIEKILGDYIRNNPNVIVEALNEMEQRRRLEEFQEVERQIGENRDDLLNDPGSPVGGNPSGDVTVVEFFDYRCTYCKAVAPRLTELLKDDGNIRFVYKEWPILGPVSVIGARAALSAWKQGMYSEFHDRLMAESGQLSEGAILSIAREMGLDIDRLREDMNSQEVDSILQRNMELAGKLRINGTPAFVIGDVLVPGAIELTDLKDLVEKARSGG